MNNDNFIKHVAQVNERICSSLVRKSNEYAPGHDRLQNFIDGGRVLGETQEKYLIGLVTKHYIALIGFINQLEDGFDFTEEYWFEKTGDIINYMILLEAIIKDRKEALNE